MFKSFKLPIFLLSVFFVSLLISPASASTETDLIITGDNDVEAVKLISEWLDGNGFLIKDKSENWVAIETDVFDLVLAPKTSAEGLDRLIFQVFLAVKDEYKNDKSNELMTVVQDMNNNLNIAQFSIDAEKDMVILNQLTFIDKLTFNEVKLFVDWFNSSLVNIVKSYPEASKILK